MTLGQGLRGLAQEWNLGNYYQQSRYSSGLANARVLGALQTIVDATTPESGYLLSFVDEGTAGTDFAQKRVLVSSKALREWSPGRQSNSGRSIEDVFMATAGMICHEVAHVRYGQHTAEAVALKWNHHPVADTISNILDDVRIEKRFSADFAGVPASVFANTAEWIIRDAGRMYEEVTYPATTTDGIQFAIGAVRYEPWLFYRDPEVARARDWWTSWAFKYSADDTVETHIAGVQAALDWLAKLPRPAKQPAPPQPPPGGCTLPGVPPPESVGQADTGDGSLPGDPEPEEDEDEDEGEPGEGKGEGSGENEDESGEPKGGGESKGESKGEGSDETKDKSGEAKPAAPDAKGGDKGGSVKGGEVTIEDMRDTPIDDALDFDKNISPGDTKADKDAQKTAEDVLKSTLTKGEALDANSLVLYRDGYPTGGRTIRNPQPAANGDAQALEEAFNSTKYTPSEYEPGHALGRLRSRDAWKAARGQQDVFSRKSQVGDTSVHLVLVIDWSGSMALTDGRAARADRLVAAIAEGLAPVHNFRLTAYHYNSAVYRVWGSRDGTDPVRAMAQTMPPTGGTPTGDALDLVMTDEVTLIQPDERLLVCSITDGEPDDEARVRRVVNHWRERGVGILGVNVVNVNSNEQVIRQYGEEGALVFDGRILDLADDLTEKVGRVLQGAKVGM